MQSVQCQAKSKRSGKRCRHRVIGGTVCHMHGQNKRTKAKRARTIALADQVAATPHRHPVEILLDALRVARVLGQRALDAAEAGDASPELVQAWSDANDHTAGLARAASAALVEARRTGWVPPQPEPARAELTGVQLPEQVGDAVYEAVNAVFTMFHLDSDDWVRQQLAAALRAAGRGQPPQVPSPPVHVWRRLMRGAARELGMPDPVPLSMVDIPPRAPLKMISR